MPEPPVSPAGEKAGGPNAYMQIWAASMAHVLGQIAGAPFAMECAEESPSDALPDQENDVRILIVLAGALRGEMSLRIPQTAALATAQLFLGEARDAAAEFTNDQKEAFEELLRQMGGHAATALKSRWGEVQLRLETSAAPTWSAATTGWLDSAADAPHRLWMEWQLSAALNTALSAAENSAASQSKEASQEDASVAVATSASGQDAKMGLFMDVELGVCLRFGSRRMLLREVLELNSGSVVELDRQVQEPADLLLDGKLIARGEVVVVDGSYGLRVTEVMSS